MPDLVLDHSKRQGAAALAPDTRQYRRGLRPGAGDNRANRRASGRPVARAGAVAKPVPDPSELSRDRTLAAGGEAEAAAPARDARGDSERDGERDRRSAVLPAELRQDVFARRSPRLRTAARKYPRRAGAPSGTAAAGTGLRSDALGRGPRNVVRAVPELRRGKSRCGPRDVARSAFGARIERRRRPLRNHLRRQLPDLSADAFGPATASAATNCQSRSWWPRSRARPRF